ncbi:hypothetical protein [Microcoleus asticus]|uniref:Uncharacterized protein n=1 Tax=Microcoleus asticus IPMA8 TaxID=2563858 RepID=A0ABX2D773_9CYAN|nr:hypothetical protein [Microcoleus asticus]NQE38517.1 hypothetical protein [Microcoleus asticus IPMA8]
MSEYTDLLREYARLSVANSKLSIDNSQLLVENLQIKAESMRLAQQLEHMKNLTKEMYYEFRLDRPNGNLKENNRESLELSAGRTLYVVQYLDTKGNSFISTEGFTSEGDIAPKLFYFGYAVFFLVETLFQQGFATLPDRFLRILSRNPKFLKYVLKEFQRVLSL